MSFNNEVIAAHGETVTVIGEAFTFGSQVYSGVLSELDTESGPDVAGFNESASAILTITKAQLSAAFPTGRIQGRLITRAADSKQYRIAQVTDNGGGLVDLQLTDKAEAS